MKDHLSNKKLILHFDARNTLFVADFKSKLTMEKALNTYISGLAWGVEEDNEWVMTLPDLSTKCPINSSLLSYYRYMEKKIVKTASDRPLLRETLGRFTQDVGKKFESIFESHLKLLQWSYETEHDKALTVKGDSGRLYHYILPTFFYLMEYLYDNQRDFAIIIRTYGFDIPNILEAIDLFINGHHPLFSRKFNINININDKVSLRMSSNGYVYKSEEPPIELNNESQIFSYWNKINGVIGCRDDFDYWLNNSYNYKSSKPLWINYKSIDSTDERIYQHIFFDDCIRPRDNDSIVHLRKLKSSNDNNESLFTSSSNLNESNDNNVVDGKSLSTSSTQSNLNKSSVILSIEQTIKLIDVNIVQSDLLECIRNKNYFIEKVQICERNFDGMFENNKK